MNKNRSEIKTGIILSYVYIAVSMIAGLIYVPRMVSMLGESEYGLYGLAKSTIEYLSIMGLGLQSALVRFTSKYIATGEKDKEQRLGGMFLVIYSVIAVVVMIAGVILSQNLGFLDTKLTAEESSRLSILVIILAFNLAIGFPMGVFGGVITAHERFTFRNGISVIREISMPIVTLLFLSFGYRSVGMVMIQTVFSLITMCADLIYTRKVLNYHPVFAGFDGGVIKEIISYTVFIFIGEVTDRISNATNSTILAAVSGTAAIAVFSIGAQLYAYYLNFSASIGSFFLPRIVKMTVSKASDQELSDLFIKVGRIQLYVVALIFSGFIAFGQDFIHLWVGDTYAPAYWIAVFCMAPTLIGRSQSLGVQILLARNKHQFRAIFYFFITLLDIAISIPLGKLYAGVGVAIGTMIAQFIGPVITMNIYYAKKMHLDIKGYWKRTLPIIFVIGVLTTVAKVVNWYFPADNWLKLALQIVLYFVIYAMFVYKVLFNEYERDLVGGLLGKFIKKKAND
ncbi:MAG: oligosaccharide flippase family protein [Clostridia bacterium]|nr:oligosaccharide flippase family protein [Clostridia bacterium]